MAAAAAAQNVFRPAAAPNLAGRPRRAPGKDGHSLTRTHHNPIQQDPTAAEARARAYASRCAVVPDLVVHAAAAWRPLTAVLAAGLAARPPAGAGGADVAAALARIVEVCPHVHR